MECLLSVSCRGEEGERWLVQRAAGIQLFPNRHLPLRYPEIGYLNPAFPAPPPVVPGPAGDPHQSGEEGARTGSPAALLLGEPRCAPAAPAPRGAEWERPSPALRRGGDEAGPWGGAAYPGPARSASGKARFSKWMKFFFFFERGGA